MKRIAYSVCTLSLLAMLATSCSLLRPDKSGNLDAVVDEAVFAPTTDTPTIDVADKKPREIVQEFPDRYRFPIGPERKDVKPAVEDTPASPDTPAAPDAPVVVEPTHEEMLERELLALFKQISAQKGGSELLRAIAFIQQGKFQEAYEIISAVPEGGPDKLLVAQVKTYLQYKLGDSKQSLAGMETLVQRVRSELPLGVDTLKLCRRVMYYAKYEEFSQLVFDPGEEVIVYSEPVNFCCIEGQDGFLVSLSVRCAITDSNGKTVWTQTYSIEHQTSKYVYDFFTCWRFNLPRAVDGNYTLSIEIQDKQSASPEHVARKELVFEIRERARD